MAVLVASIVIASMLISAFAPGDKNSLEGRRTIYSIQSRTSEYVNFE